MHCQRVARSGAKPTKPAQRTGKNAVPGLRRYVLTHILAERTRVDIPSIDADVDGIAELWYDDLAAMQLANASPEAKRLHDDGATFIGRIKMFTTQEQMIIPRPDKGV